MPRDTTTSLPTRAEARRTCCTCGVPTFRLVLGVEEEPPWLGQCPLPWAARQPRVLPAREGRPAPIGTHRCPLVPCHPPHHAALLLCHPLTHPITPPTLPPCRPTTNPPPCHLATPMPPCQCAAVPPPPPRHLLPLPSVILLVRLPAHEGDVAVVALAGACGAVQGAGGAAGGCWVQPPRHVGAVAAIGLPQGRGHHSHGGWLPLAPPGPCPIPIPCGTHRGQGGFGGQRGVGAAPAGAAEPQAPPHLLAQHHAEEEDEGALGWRGGHVGMAWGGHASQPPPAHCRGHHRHHRQIKGPPHAHWVPPIGTQDRVRDPPVPTGCPPLSSQTGQGSPSPTGCPPLGRVRDEGPPHTHWVPHIGIPNGKGPCVPTGCPPKIGEGPLVPTRHPAGKGLIPGVPSVLSPPTTPPLHWCPQLGSYRGRGRVPGHVGIWGGTETYEAAGSYRVTRAWGMEVLGAQGAIGSYRVL